MPPEPCLHRPNAAFARLGVGRSKGFELLASGELRSVTIGRLRLVPESAIVDFISRLEAGTLA
jgi:excisionase family DNA binding protein